MVTPNAHPPFKLFFSSAGEPGFNPEAQDHPMLQFFLDSTKSRRMTIKNVKKTFVFRHISEK